METRNNEDEIVYVSQEQIEQGENLRKILRDRLTCHIFNQIEDRTKHDHWILKWAFKNVSHNVSIMVILKQVKQDIQSLDKNATLLDTPSRFKWVRCNINSNVMNYVGAYLYFDVNDRKWVRSGKSTVAGGFISRHKQHEKQSK